MKKKIMFAIVMALTFTVLLSSGIDGSMLAAKAKTTSTESSSTKKSANRCPVANCHKKPVSGSSYCSTHKCKISGCGNKKYCGSQYCSNHNAPSKRKNIAETGTSASSSKTTKLNDCKFRGCKNKECTTTDYCSRHTCSKNGCIKSIVLGSKYCKNHQSEGTKKSDPYDVYDFDSADDFADEWAEEFGDGDEKLGYDDAEDYWREHHKA